MKCSGLAGSSVCASRGIVFFPRALAARGVLHSRGCTLGSAVGGQLLRRGCCRTPTMATVAATQPQQAQSDSCAEDMATASVLISPGAWQSQVEAAGIQHDPVLPASDAAALSHAAELLRSGQLMAIPTETVYGLAANALDSKAVKRIYAAKQRPADNPLIIHISSLDMLASLYPEPWQLPQVYSQVVEAFWPGPLTILLPRSPKVPEEVTCGQPTMAVRMPAHPVARALIALSGVPLAAPSANSSGKPSPTTAAHVLQDLSGRIPLVVDGGACGVGLESTVLDGLRAPPVVLRPGGVTYEQLKALPGMHDLQVYRKHFVDAALEEAPTTPGMKYRHYSPSAQVTLLEVSGWSGDVEALRAAASAHTAALVLAAARELASSSHTGSRDGGAPADIQGTGPSRAQQGASASGGQQGSGHRGPGAVRQRRAIKVGALRTTLGPGHAPGSVTVSRITLAHQQPQGAGANSQLIHPLQPGSRVKTVQQGNSSNRSQVQGADEGRALADCGSTHATSDHWHQQQQPSTAAGSIQGPPGSGTGSDGEGCDLVTVVLGDLAHPAEVGRQLFRALRLMDEQGVGAVVVEGVMEEDEGLAIMNRLRKAASRVVVLGEQGPAPQ